MKPFKDKVLEVVRNIPKGKTLSYKEVAKLAGHALASRAVGSIMKSNHDKSVPCHRVIRSDGKLGGYNGLQGEKLKLLKKEGAIK
ncbi:MAG: MGMT family protein [Candidatus Pacebacteria bacterium]|nr:MGMT family protein [Candidatus Paceibacterota bacterium]MBP9839764.1 MGMT family protein [Candidatus Paceibacterota bacterium]MDQ5922511.1 methylated-DNA-[protein]-cysteine S-methyltransferase [Patescibacteria group bacterium]